MQESKRNMIDCKVKLQPIEILHSASGRPWTQYVGKVGTEERIHQLLSGRALRSHVIGNQH